MKYARHYRFVLALLPMFLAHAAQHKTPFQTQAPSTLKYGTTGEDHADVVEITNVKFELVWSPVPGRPHDENIILRNTTRTRRVVGDMGMEATTTVEAWPLGVDPKEKPLYTLTVAGDEPVAKNNEVLIVPRGLEEVEWWSVYKVGTGARLFDTYIPLVTFLAHEKSHYAGIEVPPDDTKDSRLKAPNVVAVLTVASGERVLGEALITCDDAKRAQLLRSFADATRNLTYSSGALRLTIAQSYPVRPLATITVPIGAEGMDIAHAQVPQGMHVTAWKR